MTYGRVSLLSLEREFRGAAASHSAELVRGTRVPSEGPLIRPSGTFSPRGEGTIAPREYHKA